MLRSAAHGFLADVVLIIHAAFVGFVVFGLVLILLGGLLRWRWIRNPWFRTLHLGGIVLVVVQAWLGIVCPLTILELSLRERAGQATHDGTFISYWLHRLLYYEAPAWVFVACYTAFGLIVVLSWVKFRPRSFRTTSRD